LHFMSLQTRCPACDTVFKIVPDQLKASRGWVRCGRCAEVFDASAHAASTADAKPWPQTIAPEAVSEIASKPPSPLKYDKIAPNIEAPQAVDKKVKAAILTSKNKAADKSSNAADVSFIRIAKNKAFWQRAAVTRTLSAACIGLAALLFMQVVYSQRNQLAASNQTLKPVLIAACQTLGCTLEPYKNIDAFKIDSSSFQKVSTASAEAGRVDVFALKLSLKNSADMPLAIPAIELTLTEASDKPVLRRVLLVKDLGFSGATLAANGDWMGGATVVVTPNTAMPAVSGYRVLLFYP
jgi:predicted Zn finger-like uncharacterized protein